ncbi:unnamed protein product [Caenorhabditis sp. 36 PRJEB53466]|nr:unnamed protein product [Caenorhabditis sp. 36 PRJEB53466]
MPQFYCHRCRRSFDLEPEARLACVRCNDDFIELINIPPGGIAAAMQPNGVQALHQIADMFRQGLERQFQQQAQQQQQQNAQPPNAPNQEQPAATAGNSPRPAPEEDMQALENFVNRMFEMRPDGEGPRAQPQAQPQGPGNVSMSFQIHGGLPGRNANGILPRQFFGNIIDADPTELEAAMNDMLAMMENNIDGRGFNDNEISMYLPMKKVTQQHVDNGAQCTTCFDTFKLGDDVGCLDCNHIFHRPCIEPWLKNKNSCPVCRQNVNMRQWKRKHQEMNQEAVLEDLD